MYKPVVLILILFPIFFAAAALQGFAGGKQIVDVSDSPHVKLRTIGLDEARWTSGFWADRWDTDRRVTIPTMKQVMEMPTNSATFHNLRVAAGEVQGEFFGNNWSDGDCYKWIQAAASMYAVTKDPELDRQMDEVIAVIANGKCATRPHCSAASRCSKPRDRHCPDQRTPTPSTAPCRPANPLRFGCG